MTFKCLDGCSDCCGNLVFKREFIEKHKHKYQISDDMIIYPDREDLNWHPVSKDGKCVFLDRTQHRCSIYEDRPPVCRIYGTGLEEDLLCIYLKPNGNKRSEANKRQVLRKINHMVDSMINKKTFLSKTFIEKINNGSITKKTE